MDEYESIKNALKLKHVLKEKENFSSEVWVSSGGIIHLRLHLHTQDRRDFISLIHKLCGVDLEKNRTPSNRTTYVAQANGFTIHVTTDLPFCKDAPFHQDKVERIRTWYECPLPMKKGEESIGFDK